MSSDFPDWKPTKPQDKPGFNFLEMFSKNAPKEQVLQAAHKYFEGEQISIISSNPEKRTNTVHTIGGGYGVENPSKVKTEEVEWDETPATVGEAFAKSK